MKLSALFLIPSLGAFGLVAQAAPVGMVAHVTGQVSATQGGKKAPLRLLGRLEPGATVATGPNSSAVIVLFGDGSRFQLGAGARATVSENGVTGATKMAALAGPSANAVKMLGNARVGAVMARPASSYQRLLANSPAYFLNPAPRFDWLAAPGAVRYTFTLFDSADNVVWSTTTDKTGVDFPTGVAPLTEKKPYLWKISAFGTSGKAVDSRFGFVTVLSTADAATLDSLIAELKEQAKTATDKSPQLLMVETYRSFGVLNSALEVLDSEDLKTEQGVPEAKNDLLDALSPIARTLVGRSAEPVAAEPSVE